MLPLYDDQISLLTVLMVVHRYDCNAINHLELSSIFMCNINILTWLEPGKKEFKQWKFLDPFLLSSKICKSLLSIDLNSKKPCIFQSLLVTQLPVTTKFSTEDKEKLGYALINEKCNFSFLIENMY